MKNESLTQTLVVVVSYETKIKLNWTSYILILFKPCLFCTPKKKPKTSIIKYMTVLSLKMTTKTILKIKK